MNLTPFVAARLSANRRLKDHKKLNRSTAQKVCHSGSLATTGSILAAAASVFVDLIAGLILLAGRLVDDVARAAVTACATGSEALIQLRAGMHVLH
ncbi:MAG: hypothetical protein QOD67_1709 [Caballeronia sp.]|jgi:hypothetical protein|nr:hypothetical protein [Caballeronia sp.]